MKQILFIIPFLSLITLNVLNQTQEPSFWELLTQTLKDKPATAQVPDTDYLEHKARIEELFRQLSPEQKQKLLDELKDTTQQKPGGSWADMLFGQKQEPKPEAKKEPSFLELLLGGQNKTEPAPTQEPSTANKTAYKLGEYIGTMLGTRKP